MSFFPESSSKTATISMEETAALQGYLTCTFNRAQIPTKPGSRDGRCESATTELLQREQMGYLLSYLNKYDTCFHIKEEILGLPIKIKDIIYRKALRNPQSTNITEGNTSWDDVGMFWHDLQYHHRIPNWERMSLWKLASALLLWPAVSLTHTGNHPVPRHKKAKRKEGYHKGLTYVCFAAQVSSLLRHTFTVTTPKPVSVNCRVQQRLQRY